MMPTSKIPRRFQQQATTRKNSLALLLGRETKGQVSGCGVELGELIEVITPDTLAAIQKQVNSKGRFAALQM